MYAADQGTVETAPATGGALGTAHVLDCDGSRVDEAVAVRVRGVPPSVAIAVIEGWPGLYVAEGSDVSDWPPTIRLS